MYLGGFPMLARNWERDRALIDGIFRMYLEHAFPVWLILFVEGTRLTARKLAEVTTTIK